MKIYYVTIKEKGSRVPLTTSYTCTDDVTEDFIIKFFGLNEPDVEWFAITLKSKSGILPQG